MKIATWNVNNVRKRLPLLLEWLQATRPDVVALQELKTPTAQFPADAVKAAGYDSLVVGQPTWNGVALLARRPLLEVRRQLPGDEGDRQARYVEAAVGGLIVAAVYAPNGNPCPGPKFAYKLAWLARMKAHAAELQRSGHPVVLAGDFNIVPTDDDVHDPAAWRDDALMQPQARAVYRALLAQGWRDALRMHYPRERMYTFWDYRRQRWERDAGLRIDHLLLSTPLHDRLRAAGIDRGMRGLTNPSDHAPAWIDLR